MAKHGTLRKKRTAKPVTRRRKEKKLRPSSVKHPILREQFKKDMTWTQSISKVVMNEK